MRWKVLLFVGMCVAISACGTATKEKLGLAKKAPDEFMVSPRSPLSLPPEYDLLPVGVENYYKNTNDEDLSDADQGLLERIAKHNSQANNVNVKNIKAND